MSAGLIVTRVASEDEDANLGQDISTQVLAQPKAFAVAASLLLGIGIIPGLPTVPFLLMAFLVGGLAYLLLRGQMAEEEGPEDGPSNQIQAAGEERDRSRSSRQKQEGQSQQMLPVVTPIALEVAGDLIPLVEDNSSDNNFLVK